MPEPTSPPQPPRHWRRLVRRAVAYALIGPGVGTGLIALLMVLGHWQGDGPDALLALAALPVLLLVGYPLGFVPAALSGLLHGLLSPHDSAGGMRPVALAALSGGLVIAVIYGVLVSRMSPGTLQAWASSVGVGLGFGALCGGLTQWLRQALARRWQHITRAPAA